MRWLWVLLLGCGDSGGATKVEPIPLAALPEAYARLLCTLLACPGGDMVGVFASADPEGCIAYGLSVRARIPIMDDIDAGQRRYDGARFATCVAAFEASCDDDALTRCYEQAIDGVSAAGETCGDDEDCAGDGWCEYRDGASCGTCRIRPATGEPCINGYMCGRDDACVDGVCVGPLALALGAPCQPGEATAPSEVKLACPADSYCRDGNRDIGVLSACERYAREGEDCTSRIRCDADLACVGGEEGTGTCRRFRVLTEVGGRCDAPNTICSPFRRLVCSDGRCVSNGDGGNGTPCTERSSAVGSGCREGFMCVTDNGVSGTCQPYDPGCTRDAECEAGLDCFENECRPIDTTCRP